MCKLTLCKPTMKPSLPFPGEGMCSSILVVLQLQGLITSSSLPGPHHNLGCSSTLLAWLFPDV